MKLNFSLLFVATSLVSSMAFAGTVTIVAPPPGLELWLGGNPDRPIMRSGEPNWTKTSDHRIDLPTITLRYGDSGPSLGQISGEHNLNPDTSPLKNNVYCSSMEGAGYSTTMEVVGFETKTCHNGGLAWIRQVREPGDDSKANDMIISFSKD